MQAPLFLTAFSKIKFSNKGVSNQQKSDPRISKNHPPSKPIEMTLTEGKSTLKMPPELFLYYQDKRRAKKKQHFGLSLNSILVNI
jgi:hypothetical protein